MCTSISHWGNNLSWNHAKHNNATKQLNTPAWHPRRTAGCGPTIKYWRRQRPRIGSEAGAGLCGSLNVFVHRSSVVCFHRYCLSHCMHAAVACICLIVCGHLFASTFLCILTCLELFWFRSLSALTFIHGNWCCWWCQSLAKYLSIQSSVGFSLSARACIYGYLHLCLRRNMFVCVKTQVCLRS